jgi:hypothetical protein
VSWHDHPQPWLFLYAARRIEDRVFAEALAPGEPRTERLLDRCGRYYEAKRRWQDVHCPAAQEGEARE